MQSGRKRMTPSSTSFDDDTTIEVTDTLTAIQQSGNNDLLEATGSSNINTATSNKSDMNNNSNNSNCRVYPLTKDENLEIQKYLKRKVAAVRLPDIVQGDDTYPGLILDGASGVGKTQQAFAFLNDGKKLVYRLLVPLTGNPQCIYREMDNIVDPETEFLDLVDDAITKLEQKVRYKKQDQDIFSVVFLQKNLSLLMRLEVHLRETITLNDKYEKESFLLKSRYDTKDVNNGLVVLFLDEVLPSGGKDGEWELSLKRLRFLRNLGRALGMRVVLAGTAATAANMIAAPINTTSMSRDGDAEKGWMEIEFLYKPVALPFPEKLHPSKPHLERPLILSLLEKITKDKEVDKIGKLLSKLKERIFDQKKVSRESMLVWLCGPWLDSADGIPASPFLVKPLELVRGHFFEPALVVNAENGNMPYFGKGMGKIIRMRGPCRFYLQVENHNNVDNVLNFWWCLGNDEQGKKKIEPAYSKGFGGIEYCLSHCVQICLALEPIMAVCLSGTVQFYVEGTFQQTFSKLWKETLPQRTVRGIDGELNEYAMFAALQLATRNGPDFMETVSAKEMIEPMMQLLYVSRDIPPTIRRDKMAFCIKYYYGRDNERDNEEDADTSKIKTTFEETKMPWMVPACSHDELMIAAAEGRLDLLEGCNIAGLTPSDQNSRLDAYAYGWKRKKLSLEWAFEFRGRSGSYSLQNGVTDLASKCGDNLGEDKRIESHAMLIAVSGSKRTQVRVWLTEKDMLRVVLVVGCGG